MSVQRSSEQYFKFKLCTNMSERPTCKGCHKFARADATVAVAMELHKLYGIQLWQRQWWPVSWMAHVQMSNITCCARTSHFCG